MLENEQIHEKHKHNFIIFNQVVKVSSFIARTGKLPGTVAGNKDQNKGHNQREPQELIEGQTNNDETDDEESSGDTESDDEETRYQ